MGIARAIGSRGFRMFQAPTRRLNGDIVWLNLRWIIRCEIIRAVTWCHDGTRWESHPPKVMKRGWTSCEMPMFSQRPSARSVDFGSAHGGFLPPGKLHGLQVFRAAASHCGCWRMGRSWIPAPACARMRWAEAWRWDPSGGISGECKWWNRNRTCHRLS